MKRYSTALFILAIPSVMAAQKTTIPVPSERGTNREVTIDPESEGDVVTIIEYTQDTLPSSTSPFVDRIVEIRAGIGLSGLNGINSGGISGMIEASSQINDRFQLDLGLSGITNQGDAIPTNSDVDYPEYTFDSWEVNVGASIVFSDRQKRYLKPVVWKYYTPFRVRYERHAQTMATARHRHYVRVGWQQAGGSLLGHTSRVTNDAEQVVVWNKFDIGSLSLGYAYRMDRILKVLPSEHFSGKNLSRSRVFYADLLLSPQQHGTGTLFENTGTGYVEVDEVKETDLKFMPLGGRIGYRGTYLFNTAGWGVFHKYEMGWRPSYVDSSLDMPEVDAGTGFYFSASVGIQF
ncbi:hypothetical protein [Phaeocystidibacter marisrubri]|uniref:DUF3570 domain-containing protein n=1 Tax=Phaeocystidibacter marisrubri TaxID=1577780 RepID=A0A6L3ZKV9_9FLAO|nr:hypothetical protein [Phaeocystidibacter marisrubri]KAB2818105.1 hypothetical protein F8C82_06800 [Phaeocystidibacter marisrubri]GGH71925.1 hypothetical protein GCM10011318_15380 [Phaeocystidibacter marisrubri]